MNRRWDTDTRGQGVGSAADYVADLQRLAAEMAGSHWLAAEPEHHLLPHLQEAIGKSGGRLELQSVHTEADGRYVLSIAWHGEHPSFLALREAVYGLVASIAESSTYVQERDGAEFEIASGTLDGERGWRGHGHVVTLRFLLPDA